MDLVTTRSMGKGKNMSSVTIGKGLAAAALGVGVVSGFAPTHQRISGPRQRLLPVNAFVHGIDMHDAVVLVEPMASKMHDAIVLVEPMASKMHDAIIHSPFASKVHEVVIQSAQSGHHGPATFSPASSKLLKSYGGFLRDHPLPTKAATAACLAAAGDAVAQSKATGSAQKYDAARGASFALFAAVYTGAFQHFWFGWLNNNLASTAALLSPTLAALFASPTSASLLVASKMFLNQFLVVPTVYMPLFFLVTGAMAGLSMEEGVARAKDLYVPLLARNWSFWLPTQWIQFSLISPEWQIPYLCAAGLLWTIILSTVGGGATATNSQDVDSPLDATDTVTLMDIGDSIVEVTADAADTLIDSSATMLEIVEGVTTDTLPSSQ